MGLRNALRRVATAVATEASAIARHGEPRAAYLGAGTFLAQGGGATDFKRAVRPESRGARGRVATRAVVRRLG